jgi:hypothetical protein
MSKPSVTDDSLLCRDGLSECQNNATCAFVDCNGRYSVRCDECAKTDRPEGERFTIQQFKLWREGHLDQDKETETRVRVGWQKGRGAR